MDSYCYPPDYSVLKNKLGLKSRAELDIADVHKRIVAKHYLRNLTASEFTRHAGRIMGDVNYVHPFREGNGRTQLQYLEQLAERAGHPIDLLRLDPSRWIQASKESHAGDYALMEQCIFEALETIP